MNNISKSAQELDKISEKKSVEKRSEGPTDEEIKISKKSRLAVTLLSWFLGVFGIHRFYLGKIGTGLLMLFTLGGCGFWALVDFIMAVSGQMKDKEELVIKKW